MCTTRNKSRASSVEHRNSKTSKIFYGVASTMAKHIFCIIRKYVDMIIDFIFSLIWDGSRKAIPDLEKKHEMLTKSAVELAAQIRNKELKSEALVQACIERIKLVNPILNAVTDERFEDALKDAREIDNMIETGLTEEYFQKKPFLGVPFTSKESHAVAGMLHTLGLRARRHVRAHEHAECVRLLVEAGAIPLAVTNVPEINKWQETRNMLFGMTNNPYHAGRSPGGSSGGEAALQASLASPISLCSDIGGSTRMPAFYCGLFGYNPTAGHTSLKGSVLRTGEAPTMASIGFVSRHLSDLIPLTKVVAGEKSPLLDLDALVDLKNVKFYYTKSSNDLRVSPICQDLQKAMNRVIVKLGELAPSTDRAPKPYYHPGLDHMYALWRHQMTLEADSFPKLLANNQGEANGLIELPKKLVGLSPYTLAAILKLLDEQVMPPVDRAWADRLIGELKEDLIRTLGEDGVLIFPSAPAPAPWHYSALLRPFNFAYWGILNVLHFPSVQVPLGVDSCGVPLGVQVASVPRRDALCVAVAARLQAAGLARIVPPCALVR